MVSKSIRKTLPIYLPVTGLSVPPGNHDEDLKTQPMRDIDLLQHSFLVVRGKVTLPIPPLIALLKVPCVVKQIRTSALSFDLQILADKGPKVAGNAYGRGNGSFHPYGIEDPESLA